MNMKKLNVVLFAFLLAMPFTTMAKGIPTVSLIKQSDKLFTLRVSASEKETYKIVLKDQLSNTLFTEEVTNNLNYIKSFDLQQLVAGEYVIEMQSSYFTKVMPLTIKQGEVILAENGFITYFTPFINVKDKAFIDFSLLNTQQANTSLAILNDKGEVIFSKNLGQNIDINQRFDVSKLDQGTYMVVVKSGDRTYKKTLDLSM